MWLFLTFLLLLYFYFLHSYYYFTFISYILTILLYLPKYYSFTGSKQQSYATLFSLTRSNLSGQNNVLTWTMAWQLQLPRKNAAATESCCNEQAAIGGFASAGAVGLAYLVVPYVVRSSVHFHFRCRNFSYCEISLSLFQRHEIHWLIPKSSHLSPGYSR